MSGRVVVLTGGVGGAKLALGMARIVPADRLTFIVNTGDDFRHIGLAISPDVDTLLYTLTGRANQAQGWGREGESWAFMESLKSLGGEGWFQLGDGDLALHVLRTHRLALGDRLSAIIGDFARAWGLEAAVLPMSDDPVATQVDTDEGVLDFQHYFVARQCAPAVRGISFAGAAMAVPAPGVLEAIERADAIVIAPSNPYLSVDPILAVPGMRAALAEARAPVVAVSPLVGGKAVKGPSAKMMEELGIAPDHRSIAAHYEGVIDGLLIDEAGPAPDGIATARDDTLMTVLDDKVRVARAALALAGRIAAA